MKWTCLVSCLTEGFLELELYHITYEISERKTRYGQKNLYSRKTLLIHNAIAGVSSFSIVVPIEPLPEPDQDQDQDSLLVKRRNGNHSPGPVIRELVPSSHQRSELSNTILCIFSG